MDGPDASYSFLEIHDCWKAGSDERIEPPIQTEYLRSGGAMILTVIDSRDHKPPQASAEQMIRTAPGTEPRT